MRIAILLLSSALLSQVAARELGTRGARRGIRRLVKRPGGGKVKVRKVARKRPQEETQERQEATTQVTAAS